MTLNTLSRAAAAPMTRRSLLAGGAALALSTCMQTVMTPELAQTVTIRHVTVSTDELGQFTLRDLPITRAQFASDLDARVTAALAPHRSPRGTADLVISVRRVLLKSPEMALLVGGPSFIDATILVQRVSDGTPIAGPTTFSGTPEEVGMAGLVGVVTSPTA